MPTLEKIIILVIDQNGGVVEGTEHLANDLLDCHNRSWVLNVIRRLRDAGDLQVVKSNGGRGCKTIYKSNRNQAGLPRSVRSQ